MTSWKVGLESVNCSDAFIDILKLGVSYDSQKTAIMFLNSINYLKVVMMKYCVFLEVQTEYLNII
jgi:hypothetical protein